MPFYIFVVLLMVVFALSMVFKGTLNQAHGFHSYLRFWPGALISTTVMSFFISLFSGFGEPLRMMAIQGERLAWDDPWLKWLTTVVLLALSGAAGIYVLTSFLLRRARAPSWDLANRQGCHRGPVRASANSLSKEITRIAIIDIALLALAGLVKLIVARLWKRWKRTDA